MGEDPHTSLKEWMTAQSKNDKMCESLHHETLHKASTNNQTNRIPPGRPGGGDNKTLRTDHMAKNLVIGIRNVRLDVPRQKGKAKKRCNICGGIFMNDHSGHGINIHQGKCKKTAIATQRT